MNGGDESLVIEGVLIDKVRLLLASVRIQGNSHISRVVNAAHYIAISVARC